MHQVLLILSAPTCREKLKMISEIFLHKTGVFSMSSILVQKVLISLNDEKETKSKIP